MTKRELFKIAKQIVEASNGKTCPEVEMVRLRCHNSTHGDVTVSCGQYGDPCRVRDVAVAINQKTHNKPIRWDTSMVDGLHGVAYCGAVNFGINYYQIDFNTID